MRQSIVTEAEVRILIQLLKKTELYETNEDTKSYVKEITQKLEK
jgi:hypothetical protein